MKIALTAQNRHSITGHAGMCRNFLVYELSDGKVATSTLIELDKTQTFHELGNDAHPLDGVDVLISGGMGQGLLDKLARRGIRAVITQETDPQRAIDGWLEGSLRVADTATCDEHEHAHEAPAHGAEHACTCRSGG